MVQVAEKFIEAVVGGQVFIPVTQVVLAELAGSVTQGLEQGGDSGVLVGHAFFRPRQAHLGEAGAQGVLPCDKAGAARSAALVTVGVGEDDAIGSDLVDIGCLVTHAAHIVGADVVGADIVAPDNQDIGFFRGQRGRDKGEDQAEECHWNTGQVFHYFTSRI